VNIILSKVDFGGTKKEERIQSIKLISVTNFTYTYL